MNKLVIAVLLIAIGQVAHSYSPYNKIESNLGSRHNEEDEDDVDLGQLFNPRSETGTESDETGKHRQDRPSLSVIWGRKGKPQHYRQNYQGVNDYEQMSQYGQYQGQGQGSVASEQPWQQHQHQQKQQSHYGSYDYDSNNGQRVGVKGIESFQGDYQYQGQNQHNINPQDSHYGSMTRDFLNEGQQTYDNLRKRVFHSDEQQQGGRFVVNQQGKRDNQQDSDENDSVYKKNSVRGSYL
ncbi:hypothetical protein PPYR_06719 [Photinus pyralis]|uniref:Uncharacterized protein n=1 Tax=Photinus pyralis TaxID=7054 RepID=A0A1Y1MTP4_PHOPY|nr:protein kinase 4-like [Photinus pyralis]KAB0798839.1 hypothetical protein PPYR_06719 [Photinus pyralis]